MNVTEYGGLWKIYKKKRKILWIIMIENERIWLYNKDKLKTKEGDKDDLYGNL